MKTSTVRYIDLFAGLGGIRIGFQQALKKHGLKGQCVFTSEIKPHAVKVYQDNFPNEKIAGDITKISADEIPNFDVLLAGFPCQAFSSAGQRRGFDDTRGTLFFEVARILKEKKPQAFFLENVEGLVNHEKGKTLQVIIDTLKNLGYQVTWKVLDASKHGVPQKRKRIYIVGSLNNKISIDNIEEKQSKLADILECDANEKYFIDTKLTRKLLDYYPPVELLGKQVKDKRGGENNIHSWDLELKGRVSPEQKQLLEELLRQRRRKEWAAIKGIPWADGMPLTLAEIATFHDQGLFNKDREKFMTHLKELLDDLVKKGYLKFELPKKATPEYQLKGYNIIAGKLSFDVSNILDPEGQAPTLVATDVVKIAVVDNNRLRRLTIREGLRLFGFPDDYKIEGLPYPKTFDLLGNSVCVKTIQAVGERLAKAVFPKTADNFVKLPEAIAAVERPDTYKQKEFGQLPLQILAA